MHAFDKNEISPARWLYSVGGKLLRIVPGLTVVIVLVTIASQLSMFAAFFLPLKAIILIGSPTVPGYLPALAHTLGRESLIVLLSLSAILFYVAYLAAERVIDWCTEHGSRRLLANSSKIALFAGQNDIAVRAYQRYVRGLAGVAFVFLAILALGVLDWRISLFIAGYWFVVWGGVFLVAQMVGRRVTSVAGFANVSSSIGFLAVFGYIVGEALFGTAPNMSAAILGLLFSRQVMQRIGGVIQDGASLYSQRLQINALFFHGHSLAEGNSPEARNFWALLAPAARSIWISAVLREIVGANYIRVDSRWHQSGIQNVAAFEVEAYPSDCSSADRYLLKLFKNDRQELAVSEATVLGACSGRALGALEFLGADSVEGLHCHVFRWGDFHKMHLMEIKPVIFDFSRQLMEFQPPVELIQQYIRSRPPIWERLTDDCMEQFQMVVAGVPLHAEFSEFKTALPRINAVLRQLPLQLINAEVGADSLLIDQQGNIVASHWGKWSIGPVGSGWFSTAKELLQLPDIHARLSLSRSDYANVSLEQLSLSVLMAAVDRGLARQQFLSVIELLPDILKMLHTLESPGRVTGEVICLA